MGRPARLIAPGDVQAARSEAWAVSGSARYWGAETASATRRRFGPDAPAMADDLKLKCVKCGSKKVGLICTPDARPNAYRKATGG